MQCQKRFGIRILSDKFVYLDWLVPTAILAMPGIRHHHMSPESCRYLYCGDECRAAVIHALLTCLHTCRPRLGHLRGVRQVGRYTWQIRCRCLIPPAVSSYLLILFN